MRIGGSRYKMPCELGNDICRFRDVGGFLLSFFGPDTARDYVIRIKELLDSEPYGLEAGPWPNFFCCRTTDNICMGDYRIFFSFI